MNFPNDVKYTKEHEWIRQEGDVAYVGITDYAKDPYGEGWLIKIKPAADADFDSLLDAEAYKALIND